MEVLQPVEQKNLAVEIMIELIEFFISNLIHNNRLFVNIPNDR